MTLVKYQIPVVRVTVSRSRRTTLCLHPATHVMQETDREGAGIQRRYGAMTSREVVLLEQWSNCGLCYKQLFMLAKEVLLTEPTRRRRSFVTGMLGASVCEASMDDAAPALYHSLRAKAGP